MKFTTKKLGIYFVSSSPLPLRVICLFVLAPDVIKKRLEIKENHDSGVQVQDCQIKICNSVAELQACLAQGNKSKAIGETLMNRDSSRSHCIFTIYVETAENQYVSVSFVRLLDDY